MLTANIPLLRMALWVKSLRATQMRIWGGFRLTLVRELAVMPTGLPSTIVVTMVTPVAQCARAFLKSWA